MAWLGFLGLAMGLGRGCDCDCRCGRCKGSLLSEFSVSGHSLVSLTAPSGTLRLGTSAAVERFRRIPVGAPPRDAAADTQASRRAKHCAHWGILIEQSVLGTLPLSNKTQVCTKTYQGMYTGWLSHGLG